MGDVEEPHCHPGHQVLSERSLQLGMHADTHKTHTNTQPSLSNLLVDALVIPKEVFKAHTGVPRVVLDVQAAADIFVFVVLSHSDVVPAKRMSCLNLQVWPG